MTIWHDDNYHPLTDMNPEFVKHVKMLVEETCDPNVIETKKIDNTQLTPEMFYEHVNVSFPPTSPLALSSDPNSTSFINRFEMHSGILLRHEELINL